MPSIADTIRGFQTTPLHGLGTKPSPRLEPLVDFGTNPGALNGWLQVPDAGRDLALVVVLHGCTQTAAGYALGSGWSDLAERFGFAALFPEQQRANNPNLCFNWFLEGDTRRDTGEALSIRQMIGAVAARHSIDPGRVFVTGLSAGGAMAGVMLATYPELFAGGSIIAGLPFAAATNVSQAWERMRGHGHATPQAAGAALRRASPHAGPWPRVTIWHGDADRTVDVVNADAIVGQWLAVHDLASVPDRTELVDGQQHRLWLDRGGGIAVEEYRIAGLGHGAPLRTQGAESCGRAGAYMLEAGISSTWRQAERWGLMQGVPASASTFAIDPPAPAPAPVRAVADRASVGVAATIERALRLAGLMPGRNG